MGNSWVSVAHEKKVLKKYELHLSEMEGEQIVEVPAEVIEESSPLWEDFLIGKFLEEAPHVAKVHVILNKIWKFGDSSHKIEVYEMSSKMMKFKVTNNSAKERILRRGMWSIANIPMVVSKWQPNIEATPAEEESVPLWVHLKNVPMNMFSWECLSFITSVVGFPVRLHPETAACSTFEIAKIFVKADLTKELPRMINFKIQGKPVNIEFIYPWLPLRSTDCGKCGHLEKVCIKKKEDMAHENTRTEGSGSKKKNEEDMRSKSNEKKRRGSRIKQGCMRREKSGMVQSE